MLKKILINVYLKSYKFYLTVRNILLKRLGPIYILYHLDGKISNITLNYYTGIIPAKYNQGNYFCRIINEYGTNYISYSGNLNKMQLECSSVPIRRKNIMLLNESKVINFDLNILDNYVSNMRDKSLKLELIFACFGVNCTCVQFVTLNPFKKEIIPINELVVSDLYK